MTTLFDYDALRRILVERGLDTPRERARLAARAQISRRALHYLYRGQAAPRSDTLARLASALRVSVLRFYRRGA